MSLDHISLILQVDRGGFEQGKDLNYYIYHINLCYNISVNHISIYFYFCNTHVILVNIIYQHICARNLKFSSKSYLLPITLTIHKLFKNINNYQIDHIIHLILFYNSNIIFKLSTDNYHNLCT